MTSESLGWGTAVIDRSRFLFAAPYAARAFASHFEDFDLHVGRSVFEEFVEAEGGSFTWKMRDPALLSSFDDLLDDDFAPSRVHPLIREFYEHTARFQLRFTIHWNPLIQPLGILYTETLARLFDQLRVPPFSSRIPRLMKSAFALIDLPGKQAPIEYRGWARTLADDGSLFYTAAVHTYVQNEDSKKRSYLCVSFPLPLTNLTVVLKPRNWGDDGFEMTTTAREGRDAGTYLLFPARRSFSMVPGLGLGESFHMYVRDDVIHCKHTETWFGVPAVTLRYQIGR